MALGSSSGGPVAAASRKPIDYAVYDGWNALRGVRLSDDGAYLAYAITPQDGDPTLVIRNLATGAETTQTRGFAPQFTADGKFVVFTVNAPKKDVDAARKAKKPDEQLPKNGLGIIEVATGKTTMYERVKSVQVAREGGRFIAFLYDLPVKASPAPAESASPAAVTSATPAPVATGEPSTAPNASPSPVPSPSPSPAPKADKKKDDGAEFVVRDLQNGSNVILHNVTEYVLADDDRTIAFATETKGGKGDGLHVRDLAGGTTADVLSGAGRYKNLAASRNGASLGFLSDVRTFAQDAPHYDAYTVDLTAGTPAAVLAVSEMTPGLPRGMTVSDNGKTIWSKDGKRMFVGVAAEPTPIPSGSPVPISVDLWTYKDLRLQSVQFHDAANDRKRTDLGVYNLEGKRYAQLATNAQRTVITNENPNYGIGLDDRPYAISQSWSGQSYADVYAVSLTDGSRKLLARSVPEQSLSPGGGFAVVWDEKLRHWASVRTSDGKRTVLAPHANVTFYDETDDHPAPPPPYGLGGYFAGDRSVIVYDRFDPWVVDLATGAATNLTRAAGRKAGVVYSVLNTHPDREALDPAAPLLLSLVDQRTYASGFAKVAVSGGVPQTLLRANKLVSNSFVQFGNVHQRVTAPIQARHAERVVFTEESYREFGDLWSSDRSFEHPSKVSNINPQLANYTWGNEELISYKSAAGIPLRAVLLTPDGFDPHKKYPMLVYFYEKWSDQYHTFYPPAPRYPTLSRYVSNGYVVLLPDVVYTRGHPGKSALASISAAIDAVTKRGFVDEKHVGIAGHSFAAYQINYMITQTNRFRAVEAGAAVTNMTSAYGGIRLESGSVREWQYEHGQSRIGATPWDRPDLYLENSGLFHIKDIHTPYLTMHNDADGAVPFSQGVEFITAMRRLNKPAYMFVFNGKDHNLLDTPADREQLKYWAVHFDEWFDYWLKGTKRPAWFDGTDYLHRGERNVRPLFGEKD
ncbi:MAG: hypothetical protein NVS3B28_14230 [Candidatus Velthaea sp.]